MLVTKFRIFSNSIVRYILILAMLKGRMKSQCTLESMKYRTSLLEFTPVRRVSRQRTLQNKTAVKSKAQSSWNDDKHQCKKYSIPVLAQSMKNACDLKASWTGAPQEKNNEVHILVLQFKRYFYTCTRCSGSLTIFCKIVTILVPTIQIWDLENAKALNEKYCLAIITI